MAIGATRARTILTKTLSIECGSPVTFRSRGRGPSHSNSWIGARVFSPMVDGSHDSCECADFDRTKLSKTPRLASGHGHTAHPTVDIFPPDAVRRRASIGRNIMAEIVQSTGNVKIDYRFRASAHLLVAYEEGVRCDGETIVEGAPRSKLHRYARKLTFVPAGCQYYEWHKNRTLSRFTYLYLDGTPLRAESQRGVADVRFTPRVFFEDEDLWHTTRELADLVEHPTSGDQDYFEALGAIVMHKILRLHRGETGSRHLVSGGLAAWQQRIATTYIEEHLADQIELTALAQLVRQSPFHFCRAFKQSLGIPPLRYQTQRRIDRAKLLLAKPTMSVTDIGLAVGFGCASSFATTFRKATGFTPTAYRRSLG
jgi:AraC family transcriptional regulator